MTNFLLYLASALIWSSTWLAIQFQLGHVPATWSVAYRFGLASFILVVICLIRKKSLRFSAHEHLWLAAQGAFLFCGNYILFYLCSKYLISGLVAVIFAGTMIMNIIHSRLLFGTHAERQVFIGAILGIVGLATVFGSQFITLANSSDTRFEMLAGLALGACATILASWGNLISNHNQKRYRMPILQSNAIGMAYGAFFTVIVALLSHSGAPTFDFSVRYMGSLLYLSLFGTVLAFGCYLSLLNRIGPERAAYTYVVLPVIALLLSTEFEGFQWALSTYLGISLVVVGNVLALTKNIPLFYFRSKPATENL